MKFSLVLALTIAFNAASTATAQQPKAVVVTPCTNETPSRPTLKRRQTNPDDQQKVEQQTKVAVVTVPCDSASAESDDAVLPMKPENSSQSLANKPVTIKFEGLTAIEESDVRRHSRHRSVNRSLDSGVTSESIADAEALLKSLLSDHGHRHAAVSSRVEQVANGSPLVTFVISEGPFFTISEIRFEGNRVFSEQLLSADVNDCLARNNKERPKVYRTEVFEYCSHLLTNFERSQGYLQARFGEPRIAEVGEGLIITVPSEEGMLYRVGWLKIEGADHVAEQDIRKMLDIRSGDVANGEKISKTLYEDLKAVYGEKGFIQYTAEIQPEFHYGPSVGGIVNFTITIDEGRRFRIRKISFKGDVPEPELRQLLALREGDVYNQKLFEESVTKMNEAGSFNWIDKDKDVDYRTNEEEGLVSLVITVTKRSPMH